VEHKAESLPQTIVSKELASGSQIGKTKKRKRGEAEASTQSETGQEIAADMIAQAPTSKRRKKLSGGDGEGAGVTKRFILFLGACQCDVL
jgi:hypothetical protein